MEAMRSLQNRAARLSASDLHEYQYRFDEIQAHSLCKGPLIDAVPMTYILASQDELFPIELHNIAPRTQKLIIPGTHGILFTDTNLVVEECKRVFRRAL
jgi:hypothetical protein